MRELLLPYGSENIACDLEIFTDYEVLFPSQHTALPHPYAEIEKAITNPLGLIPKITCLNNNKIAIAINDDTRPVPLEILLPPLLDWLIQIGFKNDQIIFFIASGTHVPLKTENIRHLMPEHLYEKYVFIAHVCDDQSNLVFLGNTSRGTPVWINKAFMECQYKILVGDIEPHHFAGFSGGYKTAAIGLAGRKTITANHTLLINDESTLGSFENNPLRQDIDEIGKIMGIDFALNAILNPQKELVSVFFGNPDSVMQQGVPISKRICQTKIVTKFDLVIASAGGEPKDINFYQAQKALTHAGLLCKDGGMVILLAACKAGSGSKAYEKFMEGLNTPDEVLTAFKKSGFEVGPHKAFQVAKILKKVSVILISEMSDQLVKKMLLIPSHSLEDAIDEAKKVLPKQFTVAFLPYATHIIPIL